MRSPTFFGLLASILVVWQSPASAQETGSISGTVTAQTGGAVLEGVEVSVYRFDPRYGGWTNYWPNFSASVSTDADGNYTMIGLPAGSYRLGFRDSSGEYAPEFYNDAASVDLAISVSVFVGQDLANVNVALADGATISGAVRAKNGGAPVGGVEVGVVRLTQGRWMTEGSAVTDADGNYRVGGLAAGSYRLSFWDGSGHYVDANPPESPTSVVLRAGEELENIDAALADAATITGTLRSQNEGVALEGIRVQPFTSEGSTSRSAVTDEFGNYTIRGLWADNYRLEFRDPRGNYAPEFYNDTSTFEAAQVVTLAEGQELTGIDVLLDDAATISGRVRAANGGRALQNVDVSVYRYEARYNSWGIVWTGNNISTDSSGNYTVKGLTAGSYRLEFRDISGEYATEFYNDALEVGSATSVRVGVGEGRGGVDVFLVDAATISGTVRAQTGGVVLEGVQVGVSRFKFDAAGNYWGWEQVGWAHTEAGGNYTVKGLPAGSYRLEFRDISGEYVSEFYNGAVEVDSATSVAVGIGELRAGIDVFLVDAATISGTVRAQTDGAVLEGVEVSVYRYDPRYGGWTYYWPTFNAGVSTDADGNYTVKRLPAGSYRLEFRDTSGEYATEFYNDALAVGSATGVAVGTAENRGGIDVFLDDAATISGTVRAQTGGAVLEGVQVGVYRFNAVDNYWQQQSGWAYTEADGNYTVKGLPAGSYRLEFRDTSGEYVSEFYNDALGVDSATNVTVGTGEDRGSIDVFLVDAATISGTVRAQTDGAVLEGVQVGVSRFNAAENYWDGEQVGWAYTEADGNYTVKGLPAGIYRLEFRDTSGQYATEFYNDALEFGSATSVTVGVGEDRGGIDGFLGDAATISGRITAENGGDPLEGVWVEAYRYIPRDRSWDYINRASTDITGDYEVNGLPAGTYRLLFSGDDGVYAPEYYNNASTYETAQGIVLIEGQGLRNFDAALAVGATISGTVTSQNGAAALEGIDVSVYRFYSASNSWERESYWLQTDAAGNYSVKGLPAGIYRLGFSDPNGSYAEAFYGDAWTVGTAASVTVATGDNVTAINIALADGASISGTVTTVDGGTALEGVKVDVYQYQPDSGDWIFYDQSPTTDSSGSYVVQGLAPGSYRLRFIKSNGQYATEYYTDAWSLASAQDVVVGIASDVTGVDVSLSPGGAISGVVTGQENGAPLALIGVECYRWSEFSDSWEWFEKTWTDGEGSYALKGLPDGAYIVKFVDWSGVYLDEFHGDAPNQSAATPIVLSAGGRADAIQASLVLAGFDAWLAGHGIAPYGNHLPADDYDRDGYSNGDEYLFGTNPAAADSGRLMEVATNGASVTLEFLKLNQGATYILQETADLSSETWTTSPVVMTESPDQSGVAIGYTRMRSVVPASGKKFLRVRATY